MMSILSIVRACWKEGPLTRLTMSLAAYSIAILIAAAALPIRWGFAISSLPNQPRFIGYFEKASWWLFPIYWPILCGLLYLTWDAFSGAWKAIQENGVLRIEGADTDKKRIVGLIQQRLHWWRCWAAALAALVAILLVYFDSRDLSRLYSFYKHDQLKEMYKRHGPTSQTLKHDLKLDETHVLRFMVVETNHGLEAAVISTNKTAEGPRLGGNLELDFTLASYVPADGAGEVHANGDGAVLSPWANGIFIWSVYAQEFVAAALGLLALFQCFIQCLFFWFLEKLFDEGRVKIVLQPYSHLHEFGLESWNHVLNNIYWVFSAALLIPIISRHSQSQAELDSGQIILQVLVPLLIALPMLMTIIGRQQRLPAVNLGVAKDLNGKYDPQRLELFHAQRLWPLDKNWVSKLGIVLAFLLLSYLLGVNLLNLASG